MTTSTQANAKPLIKLLKADHDQVKALFDEFEKLHEKKNSNDKKAEIVNQICQELTLHALAEEAIVYPMARESIEDTDLMDEADVEHAGAKNLINELEKMDPEDSHYNAKVTVLREYIEHHVKEEEGMMFPELEKSGIDGAEIAEEIIQFKEDHKKSKPATKKGEKKKSHPNPSSARSTK